MRRRVRKLFQALCFAALAMAGAASGTGTPISVPLSETPLAEEGSALEHAAIRDEGVQVFTSAGHAVGFDEDGYTVAGLHHALRVGFVGARRFHPLTAKDTSGTNGKATPLDRVSYRQLWPGIDLSYDAGGGILRSTYQLAPGADPGLIELTYNVPVSVAPDGSLGLRFDQGTLRESAPVAWQVVDGERIAVAVAFRETGRGRIGFVVGECDSNIPLIIDPTLSWHTFLGGSGSDGAHDLAVDGAGNLFVTGESDESWGTPLTPHLGQSDIVVSKLDSAGQLLWHTFLGGSGEDRADALALDGSGNLFVAGSSFSDIVVSKIDSSGQRLWRTFLGGSGEDGASALAFGTAGDLYVAGYSDGNWSSMPLNPHLGQSGSIVAKLTAVSSDLVASVLPSSRSVQVGDTATVFATMINSGTNDLANCTIVRTNDVPSNFGFWRTNPQTNAIVGEENQGVDLGAGAAGSFVLALKPSAPFDAVEIRFAFACDEMEPAPVITGVNTLLMSASTEPIADVVALAATLNNDGIVDIPGASGIGVFSVASINVGAGATVRVSADTGGATLPMSVSLCETDPATGVCLGDIAGTVTTNIRAGATPTFGIFVAGDGEVPFNPASNRVFVRFVEVNGGVVRGATSVAVRTQ